MFESTCAAIVVSGLAGGPGIGDRFPAYLPATAVQGAMPGFGTDDRPALVAFLRVAEVGSRQSLPALDAVATAHGTQVAVAGIALEAEGSLREFASSPGWADRLRFTLASDPSLQAVQTVFGPGALPRLPTAFIVKGGIVQWTGSPLDAGPVVSEVAAGRWDLDAARVSAEQRRLWDGEMARIDALGAAGKADEALSALEVACEIALPSQAAGCPAHRFRLLVAARRVPEAIAVGEAIMAAPTGPRQPAGLAWTIVKEVPGDRPALEFALRAALAADKATGGRDAMVGGVLARVQYLSGDRAAAAATVRRALPHAVDPDTARSLREDLGVYEPAKKASGPRRD